MIMQLQSTDPERLGKKYDSGCGGVGVTGIFLRRGTRLDPVGGLEVGGNRSGSDQIREGWRQRVRGGKLGAFER